jgi:hypothetical protein
LGKGRFPNDGVNLQVGPRSTESDPRQHGGQHTRAGRQAYATVPCGSPPSPPHASSHRMGKRRTAPYSKGRPPGRGIGFPTCASNPHAPQAVVWISIHTSNPPSRALHPRHDARCLSRGTSSTLRVSRSARAPPSSFPLSPLPSLGRRPRENGRQRRTPGWASLWVMGNGSWVRGGSASGVAGGASTMGLTPHARLCEAAPHRRPQAGPGERPSVSWLVEAPVLNPTWPAHTAHTAPNRPTGHRPSQCEHHPPARSL